MFIFMYLYTYIHINIYLYLYILFSISETQKFQMVTSHRNLKVIMRALEFIQAEMEMH